ncbi:MAG TPA: sigma-70 family RNA polymerase sigma factor [Bryobacteraceae bacterium]|nr:sigma-70 family RNA polymerase sigma factor [Bryobacteraceae bacterium]
MNPLPDETVLVGAAREGNRAAFGRLYELYSRMVHGILLSRVPHGEVDDLMQDVFLAAMRRLHTLREPGAFGGWLAMIARNRAIDYHRGLFDVAELRPNTATQAALLPEAIAVMEAIQSLPDAYRETLTLRLVEGMTGPEIAERTALAPDSVRVNLHRGMKLLRAKLTGEAAK